MLHKNASPLQTTELTPTPRTNLRLMPAESNQPAAQPSDPQLLGLLSITERRCSAFFAEAAVLVLVFGILDFCLLKGRIELPWIVGALAISLGLLAASIAMDFTAQRWIQAHGWVKAHP